MGLRFGRVQLSHCFDESVDLKLEILGMVGLGQEGAPRVEIVNAGFARRVVDARLIEGRYRRSVLVAEALETIPTDSRRAHVDDQRIGGVEHQDLEGLLDGIGTLDLDPGRGQAANERDENATPIKDQKAQWISPLGRNKSANRVPPLLRVW